MMGKSLPWAGRSALLLAMVFVAACGAGGDDASETEEVDLAAQAARDPTLATCPVTLSAANGRACEADLACTFTIECRTTPQQIRCVCEGGALACTDSQGELPPGAEPRCLDAPNTQSGECPATLRQAEGEPCGIVGHVCSYEGAKCPERPAQHLDACECVADGTARVFKCHVGQCM